MKVLFIGNSHTFVHYVPARVARFCASHGKPVETTMLTHPGVGLDWHLEQSQTYYNLLYGGYDAVVSTTPIPFPGGTPCSRRGSVWPLWCRTRRKSTSI